MRKMLKVKKLRVPRNTILHIDPAPIVVMNPDRTAIAVVNAPDKVPEKGKSWVDFLFGRT